MTLTVQWLTLKGQHTSDNRDCFGTAERDGECLYIVADGSSSTPRGGEFANAFISSVVNSFEQSYSSISQKLLEGLVADAHELLKRDFPADAASFLIAAYSPAGMLYTMHAGDCRLGRINSSGEIHWLSPVHTLATAICSLSEKDLKEHPDRHILTRCFKGKRLVKSEFHTFSLYARDELVIATDGFWAEAALQQQKMVLTSSCEGMFKDDVSALFLTRTKN
jgi:serine/threonine protein phosphatase PrpC